MDQGSSLLLGIEGLQVIDVRLDADGRRVAQVVTDPELAGWCPQCGEQSTSPTGWVTTRPRDVVIGPDVPILLWRKQKWRCRVFWCERKSFTPIAAGYPGPVAVDGPAAASGAPRRSANTPGRCPTSPASTA